MKAKGQRGDGNPQETVGSSGVFDLHRPLLFSIAYRMLGRVMDAEDVVQEAYLRWQRAPEAEIFSPKACLSAVVTRLCIDQLRFAKAHPEAYVGPWRFPCQASCPDRVYGGVRWEKFLHPTFQRTDEYRRKTVS